MLRKLAFTVLLAATSSAAGATWRTAKSTNFVVYTEGSEASARSLAERLEKFQIVLRFMSNTKGTPNLVPIRIFMMPSQDAVQDTMAFGGGGGVAGYYDDDMHGSFAVMPRMSIGEDDGQFKQVVLYHELTHQFMFHNFPAAYPTWYIEGFADFYGTTLINEKDVARIGMPLENRYLAFQGNSWTPVAQVLGARKYSDVKDIYSLYAEGWLLVHYLTVTKKRPGQLTAYLNAINHGSSFEEAATKAFGKLSDLDSELHDYASVTKHQVIDLPFKKLDPGPISTRVLTAAESAMVPFEIRLSSGIGVNEMAPYLARLQSASAAYPDDPHVLSVLADAQMLAGRSVEARATVTHLLKVAPQDPMGLLFQGQLDIDALRAAKVTDDARWVEARKSLLAANHQSPRNPRILKAYYESFTAQGVLPPAGAQNGLVTAYEIMPEEHELRQMVAADFEARDMLDDAIATIRPDAYKIRATGEESAKDKARDDKLKAKYRLAGDDIKKETAREMLERLEKKKHAEDEKADKKPAAS